MTEWKKEVLNEISQTDDFHISPFREDGVTYGTPTWIWSIVLDGGLYVRAYHGQNSRWFKAAMRQKLGRITAAGMTIEVAFEHVTGEVNEAIDAVYESKYARSPYLHTIIGKSAHSATVKIIPIA